MGNMSNFIKSLTPDQRHEYATSYAVLTLHDGGLPVTPEAIVSLLDATNNTEVPPFYPTLFANFLSSPDKVDALLLNPVLGNGSGPVGDKEGSDGDCNTNSPEEEKKGE